MLEALKQIFGAPHTEHLSLGRTDPSPCEAWAFVAPRLAALGSPFLLVGVSNGWVGQRRPGVRPSLLRDGRIAQDTAWQFQARTPDGRRQVRFLLSGNGTLTCTKQRIKVFQLDANGDRVLPHAIPDDCLDSPQVWSIVSDRPAFRPSLLPHLSSVSLQIAEWFQDGPWCWVARCSFGDASRKAQALIVLDAISGRVLKEEITRYADGVPISRSEPT